MSIYRRVVFTTAFVLVLVAGYIGLATLAEPAYAAQNGDEQVRITIVCDSHIYDARLMPTLGFSVLVESGDQSLLFDAGGGMILTENMQTSRAFPRTIDTLVFSQTRGDHIDGARGMIHEGMRPTVYVPPSLQEIATDAMERAAYNLYSGTLEVVGVTPGQEIIEGVFTTGEMGVDTTVEQALVIPTENGLIIIVGGARSGIVEIVEQAQTLFDAPVQLVMGGFRLAESSEDEIRAAIESFRELGVEKVMPIHDTGEEAITMFAGEYGDNYIRGGVGRIIAVEDGQIVEVEVATTEVVPTATPPPLATPAGSGGGTLVFASSRDGNEEIYTANLDGSGLYRLTYSLAYDTGPDWSPDGKQIAFASNRIDGDMEIYVMNADGSDVRQITHSPGSDFDPAWSPDGAQIAFASERTGERQIYIMDVDGSNVRQVTENTGISTYPVWSPSGEQIAFHANLEGAFAIYKINVDGSDQQRLTYTDHDAFWPAWSPDGTQIAFVSRELYVMNADGSEQRELLERSWGAHTSDWSPDGTQLVVWTYTDREGHNLRIINADGSGLQDIIGDGTYATWRP